MVGAKGGGSGGEKTRDAGFNQRKLQILKLLSETGEATARRVSSKLGITPTNASRLLGLYHKEGLARRRKISPFGTMAYAITSKGRERLEWLERRG